MLKLTVEINHFPPSSSKLLLKLLAMSSRHYLRFKVKYIMVFSILEPIFLCLSKSEISKPNTAWTVKFVLKLVLLTLFLLVLVLSTFFLSIKWLTTQDLRQTWPSRRYGEHLLYIQRKTILVIIFLIWSKESNNPILDVSSLQNINQKGGLIPGGVLNFSPSSKKGTK